MSLYLIDVVHSLPASELLRIQKSLKMILRQQEPTDRLQQSIQSAYRRLGNPLDYMDRAGLTASTQRLLKSFGVMSATEMTAQEMTDLKRSPLTIWPNDQVCYLSADVLDALAHDPRFKKEDFLFVAIARMGVKERTAWLRWLGMGEAAGSHRRRSHILYAELAHRRKQAERGNSFKEMPAYLEDIFPDQPMKCPVAWFYREILPLYQCLNDMEHRATPGTVVSEAIRQLKCGYLFVRAETAMPDKPVRHRLVLAEEVAQSVAPRPAVPETPARQEMLF